MNVRISYERGAQTETLAYVDVDHTTGLDASPLEWGGGLCWSQRQLSCFEEM